MSFWNDPLKVAADWLLGIFTGWGMPEIAANILIGFLGVLLLISLLMVLDIFLVWVERKVVSRFQDRIGPNRVGPFGLIQPFADIIKLIIKEDTTPGGADKVVYNIAPMLSMMSVLILWAVVPLAPTILGVDLNISVLYIIAAGAIGTLSIIMAGWSSNNKFALIGAFRQVAVMVSFEIPMLTMLLIPTIFSNSLFVITSLFALATFSYAAFSTIANVLPADLYNSQSVATVSGLGGTGSGIGTIIAFLLVGHYSDLRQGMTTHVFDPIVVVAGLIPFLGMILVLLLVRNTKATRQGLVHPL